MPDVTYLLTERTWMLFVDGENFTKRGQVVMSEANVVPEGPSRWRCDVFLWMARAHATDPILAPPQFPYVLSPQGTTRVPMPEAHPASRAYFYTSMPYVNEDEVTGTRLALREIGFEPRVFPRRQGKSKAVDLALATDVLTLAGEGRYETAVIFAGDGDYVPVVEAVKRLGRHVVVGFFAGQGHGLSPELRIAADDFVDVTRYLVGGWQRLYEQRAQQAAIAARRAGQGEERSD